MKIVKVGSLEIDGAELFLIAGPCKIIFDVIR